MSECEHQMLFKTLAERLRHALPKAETGNRYAQQIIRQVVRDWAEFVNFDEARLRELGHTVGCEILFQSWSSRIQTVAEAHEQGRFFVGIVTCRDREHFDSFITLVKPDREGK